MAPRVDRGQGWFAVVVAGALSIGAASPAPDVQPPGPVGGETARQKATEVLNGLPLLFVPEQVSPDGGTGFAVRGWEASVWLSDAGLAYRLQGAGESGSKETASNWVVKLDLVGATPRRPVGEDPLPTKVSYFRGPKDQWRTGLPSYGSVVYREPWPGVDLVVSGTAGELESTFVVRPEADPSAIRLAYRGATAVRLGPGGSLMVETPAGTITEAAPVAYQEVDGRRVAVAAAFELEEGSEPGRQAYHFRLGEYDPARELVVDPVTLIYCGYIGGSGQEEGTAIAIDDAGNAYVTGLTLSTEGTFPITVGPDPTYNGGSYDAFIAKVTLDGTGLDYCGYIGGAADEAGIGVAVDAAGDAYVTGYTYSTEASFPVTVGPDLTYNGAKDAFVARVNAAGTALDYCGYIGGVGGGEWGSDVAVDGGGRAYVTGRTDSSAATFPVTVGPNLVQNGEGDAFVARVSADGSRLDYCGYIGGAGNDAGNGVAVDSAGRAYVVGVTDYSQELFPVTVGPDLTSNGRADCFVARVNADGSALEYCGYIGGDSDDAGAGIAVDAAGSAYITGNTASTEATFPVTVGPDLTYNGHAFGDGFVARVAADGTALDYCGYIGGSELDKGNGIAIDANRRAYVVGQTRSTEATFPVNVGPDLTYNGGPIGDDVFVARVAADGTALEYCGYIGGSGDDAGVGIAVDASGVVYVVGRTNSAEATFPVAAGPDNTYNGGDDAFVAKVSALDPVGRRVRRRLDRGP